MSTHLGKLVLRVSFSLMMIILHGVPKIQNLLSDDPQFPSIFGLGILISLLIAIIFETVFPFLIILGYKTRLAAIPVIVTMLVAIFDYHGQDSFAMREKPILFLIAFISIALIGAGKYSIDKK